MTEGGEPLTLLPTLSTATSCLGQQPDMPLMGKFTTASSIQTLAYSRATMQTPTQEAESLPVLREEIEGAVHSLKAGMSPGVDNIPSELLKNGREQQQ